MATKTYGSVIGRTIDFRLYVINFGIFYDFAETSAVIRIGLCFTYNYEALLGAEK